MRDLRRDFPVAPYDVLDVRVASRSDGDVAARVAVRFDEALESLRLIRVIVDSMPEGRRARASIAGAAGPSSSDWATSKGGADRCSWRSKAGPTDRSDAAIRTIPRGRSWPVLEHAVIGNIVPDFPLINKSFNLSYSGHDL